MRIKRDDWMEFYNGTWSSTQGADPWLDDDDHEEDDVFQFEDDCKDWPEVFELEDLPAKAKVVVPADMPATVTLSGVTMKIPSKGLPVRRAFTKWLAGRPQKAAEPLQFRDASEAFVRLCEKHLIPIPFIRPALPTDECDVTSETEVRLNVQAAGLMPLDLYVKHNFGHYLCDLHCGKPAYADKIADLIGSLL